VKISNNTESALTGLNLMLKVLGKEFEEEPFFKRVFLNITYKTAVRVSRLKGAFFVHKYSKWAAERRPYIN